MHWSIWRREPVDAPRAGSLSAEMLTLKAEFRNLQYFVSEVNKERVKVENDLEGKIAHLTHQIVELRAKVDQPANVASHMATLSQVVDRLRVQADIYKAEVAKTREIIGEQTDQLIAAAKSFERARRQRFTKPRE